MRRSKRYVERITLSGLLLAIILILGFIENQLPMPSPVPGIRLGISNSVLLLALYLLDIPHAVALMVLKVVLSAALFGYFGSVKMLIAFSGAVLSMLVMILLSRIKGVSMIVISMAGAVFHSVGQVLAAMAVVSNVTPGVLLYYLAVLMMISMVTGAMTGVLSRTVLARLRVFKNSGNKGKSTEQE